jgi:hypothetical protein
LAVSSNADERRTGDCSICAYHWRSIDGGDINNDGVDGEEDEEEGVEAPVVVEGDHAGFTTDGVDGGGGAIDDVGDDNDGDDGDESELTSDWCCSCVRKLSTTMSGC